MPRAPPDAPPSDSAWFEEDLVRRWLMPAAVSDNVPVVSCLRVVLVCALAGAMVWALAGYGLVRLVAG
ncbi:MAG: hypothetical protein ACRDON_02895 [Gaiellaceae bacterium]